ncbi:MAG: CsgG/HfaB family protein, partial [Planctomycetota bacterium]
MHSRTTQKRWIRSIALAAMAVLAVGCARRDALSVPEGYVKPTIAVMKFENNAPFPLKWNLGDGMRDILVDRLCATKCYHVLERGEMDALIAEMRLQNSGATRRQGRAKVGRWKNVQYLIKGTVTDFGHVSSHDGGLGLGGNFGLFGKGSCAVMGMTLYVVDVESGEIVASERLEETVRAKDVSVKAAYKDVALGGGTFYRTPLGRATAEVIDKAVRRITREVVARPWRPRVAMVRKGRQILLNGGTNRKVSVGDEFVVKEWGDAILDPTTGDLLGYTSGDVIGRVRVIGVKEKYAIAEVIQGEPARLTVGQSCELAAGDSANNSDGAG